MPAGCSVDSTRAPQRWTSGPRRGARAPRRTRVPPGGFGEPTCRACHSDAGLNEPGGELAITGAPAGYEAGRTYQLEIVLRRAGMLRAGFQLAARFADGSPAGAPAGVVEPVDG